jgi:molybdate transport system substrate-binding protein
VKLGRSIAVFVALGLTVAACSSDSGGGAGGTSSPSAGAQGGELVVFAASSLTAAFTQIGKDFSNVHPGTKVTYNFGPSDGLAGQIESEGTADVFASASPAWMDDVQSKVGVSARIDFAQNRLVVITPPDDPAGIASFADLAKPGVKLVVAAEGVPVGDYAREALKNAGILNDALANVVSNEEDDASIVAKITSGEADAGIVYASDVTQAVAPTVRAIQVPDAVNVIATYPIAVVHGTTRSDLATAFVNYVTGSAGQATLKRFGFLSPPIP